MLPCGLWHFSLMVARSHPERLALRCCRPCSRAWGPAWPCWARKSCRPREPNSTAVDVCTYRLTLKMSGRGPYGRAERGRNGRRRQATAEAADRSVAHVTRDDRDRGWLIGHFLDGSAGVRSSDAVEVKWGIHRAGDNREAWQTGEQRTTALCSSRAASVSNFRPAASCSSGKGITPSGGQASTTPGMRKRTQS
jgi:hypothetical protein